jgi:hypothetical protein
MFYLKIKHTINKRLKSNHFLFSKLFFKSFRIIEKVLFLNFIFSLKKKTKCLLVEQTVLGPNNLQLEIFLLQILRLLGLQSKEQMLLEVKHQLLEDLQETTTQIIAKFSSSLHQNTTRSEKQLVISLVALLLAGEGNTMEAETINTTPSRATPSSRPS